MPDPLGPPEECCCTGSSSSGSQATQKQSSCHWGAFWSKPGTHFHLGQGTSAISTAKATTPQLSEDAALSPKLFWFCVGHQRKV